MNFDDILNKIGLRRNTPAGLTLNQQAQLAEARRTIRKAGIQSLISGTKTDRYRETETAQGYQKEKVRSDEAAIKAVHSVNSQWGIMGIPREFFSKYDNDRLAQNAAYALCEKATLDYFGPAEWGVTDGEGDEAGLAVDFLMEPNPQQTLNDLILEAVPDTLRYDQAIWVKALTPMDRVAEMKCYHGPEFWIEIDREWRAIEGDYGASYVGPWSKGYVRQFWQHSRPGIYIPFAPKEICHFKLYPRSDSLYGTDFLSRLKWQIEYMIDSTRAAGMTFANGISPGAVMTHPQYSTLEQLEERDGELEFENVGPENFGAILHLIGEETISSFTPTMVDMEWLKGQKFVSELIWSMFGFSASEFSSGDTNRATAYINRNITKTRMLYRLQKSFELMINRQVLPFIEGYKKDWKFKFVETVELDDELKQAQVTSSKLGNAMMAQQMGIPLKEALEIADVDEDMIENIVAKIEEQGGAEGDWYDGMGYEDEGLSPEESEQYYGEADEGGDAHVEDYSGTADEETYSGEDDEEDPVQKSCTITMHNGELRIIEHDTIQKAQEELDSLDWLAGAYNLPGRLVMIQGPGIRKARVYLKEGEYAPEDKVQHDGPRGGRYYETSGNAAVKEAQRYQPAGDEATTGRKQAIQEPVSGGHTLPGIPAGVTKRGKWVGDVARASDRKPADGDKNGWGATDYMDRDDLSDKEKSDLKLYQQIAGYRLINLAARTGRRDAAELRKDVIATIRSRGDTFHTASRGPYGYNPLPDVMQVTDDELKEIIQNLDNSIKKSELPGDWTMYRGISPSLLKDIGSKLKVGDTFTEGGYGSWTLSPGRCLFHSRPVTEDDIGEPGISLELMLGDNTSGGGPRVVFKTRAHKGDKALYMDGAPWSSYICGEAHDRDSEGKGMIARDLYDDDDEEGWLEEVAQYYDDTDNSEILYARSTAWRVISIEATTGDELVENLRDSTNNDRYVSGEYTESPVLVIEVEQIGEIAQ